MLAQKRRQAVLPDNNGNIFARSATDSIIPHELHHRIPYREEEDWLRIINKLKEIEANLPAPALNLNPEDPNQNKLPLPFVSIRYPKRKPIIWPLDLFEYSQNLNKDKFPLNCLLNYPDKRLTKNYFKESFTQNRYESSTYNIKRLAPLQKKLLVFILNIT